MINITAGVSGLIFGLGLILAEMANPGKVLAFLDVAGSWAPSLALVMAGAIGVGSVAFAMAGKRDRSYLGLPINLPTSGVIDKRLVLGSLAFGMGCGAWQGYVRVLPWFSLGAAVSKAWYLLPPCCWEWAFLT